MVVLEDLLILYSKRLKRSKSNKILTIDDICFTFKKFIGKYFVIRKKMYLSYTKGNVISWLINNIFHERPYLIGFDELGWEGWKFVPKEIKDSEIMEIFVKNTIINDSLSTLSTKQLLDTYRRWSKLHIKKRSLNKKEVIKYVIQKYFKKKPVKYNYFRGWVGYTISIY